MRRVLLNVIDSEMKDCIQEVIKELSLDIVWRSKAEIIFDLLLAEIIKEEEIVRDPIQELISVETSKWVLDELIAEYMRIDLVDLQSTVNMCIPIVAKILNLMTIISVRCQSGTFTKQSKIHRYGFHNGHDFGGNAVGRVLEFVQQHDRILKPQSSNLVTFINFFSICTRTWNSLVHFHLLKLQGVWHSTFQSITLQNSSNRPTKIFLCMQCVSE